MTSKLKVLQPSGILDGTTGINFRNEISRLVNNNTKIIIVDFQNVSFMDSSGLGALVLSLKMARAHGAKLFICSINDEIQMLFELTNMDQVFQVFPNRETVEKKLLNG